MKIIVCVKQAPDSANVKIDPQTHTLLREGVAAIINPFDLFALEAALALRDEHGGRVDVISMGPAQAAEAIKETIGYGVDEGVLLCDRAFAGADTWATTAALAAGVRHMGGADVIICGKQAIDGDTAQVGPGLAQRLGLPHVAFVRRIRQVGAESMVVERQMDDGHDVVEVKLPCLITVVRQIGQVRPPSLKGKMRAKKYAPTVLGAVDLGLDPAQVGLAGSFTQVVKVFAPELGGEHRLWQGPPQETGARLVDALIDGRAIILGE
ncbi:Electron transfer flavoprotein alpha/beta-subunit [Desulfarculus baarsii DSM 2075]|uniref:Electron transfer flavoprotein alpha/beta-subunit n=1 Tax=Desulfarculus baarsii (strain ATCC 33931 / DSM 2075 / LMG 7858 / VKM B-1802 / 2st14) TaxID=644282 RepID=E1QJK9_DESB2|nr:electron transfer flavoprotein subunit beta/FixA family protein [Desulfarculus baarsii]ADK85752.1 Electron transfer flavoprotein alpha/beta-subunit [Desulfarculus baarsii DSM 2075]